MQREGCVCVCVSPDGVGWRSPASAGAGGNRSGGMMAADPPRAALLRAPRSEKPL